MNKFHDSHGSKQNRYSRKKKEHLLLQLKKVWVTEMRKNHLVEAAAAVTEMTREEWVEFTKSSLFFFLGD